MVARTVYWQRALLHWYQRRGRDLPWRRTRDPYRILVSEVMLQQTQVDRVRPKYEYLIHQWPTVQALARAPRSAVIRAWSGLGYNRRAVSLHRAARMIIREHGGSVPRTIKELTALPGVGRYTAAAVATFAGFTEEAFLDTNARRVLGRVVHGWFFPSVRADRRVLIANRRLLPPGGAATWHHALMDLGALVCKPRPLCSVCPLQRFCRAYPAVLAATRPKGSKREHFEGSDRYWRGNIVRFLLRRAVRGYTFRELSTALGDLSQPRLARVLADLVRDGLVNPEHRRFRIAQ